MEDLENPFLKSFRAPEAVSNYRAGPPRFTPGFADIQEMTAILLSEHVPENGRVLVLGAGGGYELEAMASRHAQWSFEGVDPSPEMIGLAREVLGPAAERVDFVEGYIEDATAGPFDGATCLLTLHFLKAEERLRTLREIRSRLNTGAPFVAVHSSFPQGSLERVLWLSRYEAFAVASGVDPAIASQARQAVADTVQLLSPEQDEDILRAAGFSRIAQFYRAFTWCGWVAYA